MYLIGKIADGEQIAEAHDRRRDAGKCAQRRIATAGDQFVILETDTQKGRNDGVRRHHPGERQGKLADCAAMFVYSFVAMFTPAAASLFRTWSALGGDLIGRENTIPAQAATGHRSRAVDQRVWKGFLTKCTGLSVFAAPCRWQT